jgi:hypothetical protein
MAVTITTVLPGMTTEQYDQVNRDGGISAESLPEGLVAHYASRTDDGMRIFDVWESRERFDEFMQRLMPTLESIFGDVPQIEPEVAQLQNVFARK